MMCSVFHLVAEPLSHGELLLNYTTDDKITSTGNKQGASSLSLSLPDWLVFGAR